jgi:hypothetical protein
MNKLDVENILECCFVKSFETVEHIVDLPNITNGRFR